MAEISSKIDRIKTHKSIMEELPAELTMDILSRLPVKTIIHCKLVCKKWRDLVLHSYFVNLHLSRSPTRLMLHQIDDWNVSKDPGILKLVEIEDKVDHRNPLMTLDLKLAPFLQNSETDNVGSVNGLICQWQYSPELGNNNIYICNPITREIMILPKKQYHPMARMVYGFGVSSLTGEYKVVRISQGEDVSPNGYQSSEPRVLETQVYTLGIGQWRSLGRVPYQLYRPKSFYGPHAAFMNGYCHWIVYGDEKLCRFDLDKETFELFPSPPTESNNPRSLGVLNGCLCEIDTNDYRFTIWVMKEYGIKESWHKELVITEEISDGLGYPLWDTMFMIQGLKDGSIWAICDDKLWTFYPRSERIEVTELDEYFESGIAHRPSFLKLQNFELERVHIF